MKKAVVQCVEVRPQNGSDVTFNLKSYVKHPLTCYFFN